MADLIKIKKQLNRLLKDYEMLKRTKLNFALGDTLKIEGREHLITLNHNNDYTLSEVKK